MSDGCLIVGLGTPKSPAPEDIRDFLKPFLSDPYVVDFPRWLWKPILNQIVLRVRPKKVAPEYQAIWTKAGSPLEVYTLAQRAALEAELRKDHPDVVVGHAMTYTEPSIAQAIAEMNVDNLVLIPLYPQYAPSTVADIMRQAREYCAQSGAPKLTIVDPWYDLDSYIAWHATRIKEELATGSYDKIIMSYHGVPERAVHEPASYRAQCERTTHAIMERVGDIPYEMTFQSKFGPGKWLGPATIDRMAELPGEGARNILLLTPGFFADCIETLQEIDSQNQEVFKAAGGVEFRRIAPPNADATAGQMLADIYRDAVA